MSRFFSVPLCYSLRVHNTNPMYRERERKLFVPNLFTSPVPAFIVPISSVPLFPLLCEFQPKPIINIFIGRPFGQCNVPGNITSHKQRYAKTILAIVHTKSTFFISFDQTPQNHSSTATTHHNLWLLHIHDRLSILSRPFPAFCHQSL